MYIKKCTNIKPPKQVGLNSSEWTCPPCYKRNTKNTDSSTDDTSRNKNNCVMCSKNIEECHKDHVRPVKGMYIKSVLN